MLGPGDGDWRSEASAGGFSNRLRRRLFGLSFRFSGRFALEKFQQGFHLGHDTSDFARFREKSVFHHSLVHFTQLLSDVAQVAHDLLALRLRHRLRGSSTTLFYLMVGQVRRDEARLIAPAAARSVKVSRADGRATVLSTTRANRPISGRRRCKSAMENRGFEPLTSAVRSQRSTN